MIIEMWKLLSKWFIQKAWPVIKILLEKYAKEILEHVFIKIKDFIINWFDELSKEKSQKAQESYEKANATSDPEEKKKYMYEAEFYKKEAESNEQKIKEFEKKFEDLKKQTQEEVNTKTKKLMADDLFNLGNNPQNSLTLTQNNNILRLEDSSNKH
jgi:hypothetical protein